MPNRLTVVFVDSGSRACSAVWRWLRVSGVAAQRRTPGTLDRIDPGGCILWLHEETPQDLASLRLLLEPLAERLQAGDRLLLTMQAARLAVDLGLENQPPALCEYQPRHLPESQPAIRGFLSFLQHPLFTDFHGGLYTWHPRAGDPWCRIGYRHGRQEFCGEAVAVDRFYIGNDPEIVLVWEYPESRVLCVGAYVPFITQDRQYRPAREAFLRACFAYLSRPLPAYRPLWTPPAVGILQVEQSLSPHVSGKFERDVAAPDVLPPVPLPGDDTFYCLAGERILLMGRPGRVDEVWIYPFRLLSALQLRPDEGLEIGLVHASAHAYCVRWQQAVGSSVLQAELKVDPRRPLGGLTVTGLGEGRRLEITWESDLRLMWNYPVGSNGRLLVTRCAGGITVRAMNVPAVGWMVVQGRLEALEVHDISDARESRIRCRALVRSGAQCVGLYFGGNFGPASEQGVPIRIASQISEMGEHSREHTRRLLENTIHWQCPEPSLQDSVHWALLHLDGFIASTPGVGRGFLAGFAPTTPGWGENRPGYAWYFGRDSAITAMAALAVGYRRAVADTLRLLADWQRFDGKIFHECTTSGIVHYDAADATPLFVILLARYFDWTGDRRLVADLWPAARKAMTYLETTDRDGDGFIENTDEGHGWIEGGRLHGAHVSFYLGGLWVRTLQDMARLSRLMGERDRSSDYRERAGTLRRRLNREFWMPELQHFALGKRRNGELMRFITVMPTVPIWMGVCDAGRARKTVQKLFDRRYMADWGVRMVSEEEPFYRPTGYHDGSVWPLYTGWVMLAAFRSGLARQAMQALYQQLRIRWHFAPPNMPEVLRGDRFAPAGVCPQQAWSEAMVLLPLVEGAWGIEPREGRRVRVHPHLPWHWRHSALQGVAIGESRLSVHYERENCTVRWGIEADGAPLSVDFVPPLPLVYELASLTVNGREQTLHPGRALHFRRLHGRVDIIMRFRWFFDVVPPAIELQPGAESRGPALLYAAQRQGGGLRLRLQGRAGIRFTLTTIEAGAQWQTKPRLDLTSKQSELVSRACTLPSGEGRYSSVDIYFWK